MNGVRGVRFGDLFWKTLEPHRGQGYYLGLREKLTWFARRKEESTSPVSGRDNYFGKIKDLAGIWHFAALRTPDVVIFYTLDEGCLNLAMIGSHADYPFNGKNLGASKRTAARVNGAVARDPVPTPDWEGLRWEDPSELLGHPDLPELSVPGLDKVIGDLTTEMDDGNRYVARFGVEIERQSEAEFDRYVNALSDALDLTRGIRARKLGIRSRTSHVPVEHGHKETVAAWR